jgi:hypothetical protein
MEEIAPQFSGVGIGDAAQNRIGIHLRKNDQNRGSRNRENNGNVPGDYSLGLERVAHQSESKGHIS